MTTELSVLLIEDEPALAAAITGLLNNEGIDVHWVPNGNDGFDALRTGSYDVAMVDVLLPGRNGFVICRDARAAGVTTPIIVLTAKTGAYDEAEALELGADDFLSKPFEPVVLVARLRALARRGVSSAEAREADDNIRIDVARGQLSWKGTVVKLSPREAQLAATLASGDGEPVSKETLLDRVWDGKGKDNTVEVYIGYLRKKLRGTFGNDVRVDTVRWAGYRLVAEPS